MFIRPAQSSNVCFQVRETTCISIAASFTPLFPSFSIFFPCFVTYGTSCLYQPPEKERTMLPGWYEMMFSYPAFQLSTMAGYCQKVCMPQPRRKFGDSTEAREEQLHGGVLALIFSAESWPWGKKDCVFLP